MVERARRKSSRSREEQRRREKQRRQGEYRRQEVRKRRERIRRRKRKKRRMRFLVSLVCWLLVFTAALGGVYMLLPAMCVRAEVTVEAGSPCPGLEDLLRWESGTAELLSGLSEDMELDQDRKSTRLNSSHIH